MKNRPSLYLDSCCFIDLVKEQVGKLPKDDARLQDVWYLKQLIKAHVAKDVMLCTSFLAVPECVAIEAGDSSVPQDIQDRFRRLLTSGQYVTLLGPTPKTGTISQDLRWKHGIILKGADAMHLSAAIENKCVEFFTTDERLQSPKLADAAPKLRGIGLSLIPARKTLQLPPDYKQEDMLDGHKVP